MSEPFYPTRRRSDTPLGFLDLPLELRVEVYSHLLVVSDPIIVYSGASNTSPKEDTQVRDGYRSIVQTTEERTKTEYAIVKSFTLGLLACSRQISDEAGAILYGRNTFSFKGQNTWDALYIFLQMLYVENKDRLHSLEIDVSIPKRLWRSADGICTTLEDRWSLRKVVARPTYLQDSPNLLGEGFVEHLDPAIEACFRSLKGRKSPLTLTLNLQRFYLPGLETTDDAYDDAFRWEVSLPAMIEKCRRELITDDIAKNPVDIIWQGQCERDLFLEQQQQLQDTGWIILDAKESTTLWAGFNEKTMRFSLRWR
ncbi:MAG: hypothetical protein Q9191_006139 [Dirinaria sp. TL-2023a]